MELPIRPIKSIKSALQANYSLYKPAVDGVTQYMAMFRSATVRYTWPQKVVLDTLLALMLNAILLHRMFTISNEVWCGLHTFRARLSRFRSFGNAVVQLCAGLVAKGSREMLSAPRTATAAAAAALTTPTSGAAAAAVDDENNGTHPPRRHRLEFFRTSLGKEYRGRLNVAHHAVKSDSGARGRCILCSSIVVWYCSGCSPDTHALWLCRKRKPGGATSCFDLFHAPDGDLPVRKRP